MIPKYVAYIMLPNAKAPIVPRIS